MQTGHYRRKFGPLVFQNGDLEVSRKGTLAHKILHEKHVKQLGSRMCQSAVFPFVVLFV